MAWNKSQPESDSTMTTTRSAVTDRAPGRTTATLGPSLFFKGNLSGEEDLLIEGRVEGEISLKNQSVTVGPNGKVKADIHSKSIRVDGEVNGNLYGSEEVAIRKSGRVHGNAIAPRVTLENGAQFRGSIDMNPGESFEAVPAPVADAGRSEAGGRSSRQPNGERRTAAAGATKRS